jgi:hypothetical protein
LTICWLPAPRASHPSAAAIRASTVAAMYGLSGESDVWIFDPPPTHSSGKCGRRGSIVACSNR